MHLTSGTSFFIVSKNKSENAIAKIANVCTYGLIKSFVETIKKILKQSARSVNEIDLVLFSCIDDVEYEEIITVFQENRMMNYLDYSGTYFTSSAFALHYAVDVLKYNQEKIKRILICNHLHKNNLGLTLVESLET